LEGGGKDDIVTVKVDSYFTTIMDEGFMNCSRLTEVLNDELEEIGVRAFYECTPL
jgi:hypothetical protein